MRQRVNGYQLHMGFLFGLVKTGLLVFAIVIALLIAIDGTLFANLFGKRGNTD